VYGWSQKNKWLEKPSKLVIFLRLTWIFIAFKILTVICVVQCFVLKVSWCTNHRKKNSVPCWPYK
jgi:hypothetical protein